MFLIAAQGGSSFGVGGQSEMLNYQAPYLVTIFGFMGIMDISFVELENNESDEPKLVEAIEIGRASCRERVLMPV